MAGGPFLGDDLVELCSQQLLVRVHQLEELLVHTGRGTKAGSGDRWHEPHHRGQALMACWDSSVRLISILRGLARSATGIFKVRTPAL